MNGHIPLVIPDLEFGDVKSDIEKILSTGILTSGPYLLDFERSVADRVGVSHAVATTSATAALHLALVAQGVGPGDEVLIPNFTFPATANAVIQSGATPILVDSGTNDFAMDPEKARALVSTRTRAIIPVDPFGQPADHVVLEQLAVEAGISLIVDAACSLGAARAGRECGAHGDLGCFSFHPRKIVTCGEGGMITTNDSSVADRARLLRNHGSRRTEDQKMEFAEPGFNYRMTEIQAACGLAQMKRLDQMLNDRRSNANWYNEALSNVSGVVLPMPTEDATWSFQSYVVVLENHIDRDKVISRMAEKDIETTIGTYACHQHPAFLAQRLDAGNLPNSTHYASQTLTLPLIPRMRMSQKERVVEMLISALQAPSSLSR